LVRVEKQQRLGRVDDIALPHLLATVIDDFQTSIMRKNIQLEIDLPEINLRGDTLLLRQALGNLLENAIAFTARHGLIHVYARVEEARINIYIDDSGSGIPDYAQEKIFERFYSLPRPDAAKSTGLGLPFVREVASLHGGSVLLVNLKKLVNGVEITSGASAQLSLPRA
jgi:two-component system sensor histidine kinase CreC